MLWTVAVAVLTVVSASLPLTAGHFEEETVTDDCVCVSYFNCKADGSLNVFGEGIIDIRIGEDNPCPRSLEVCCKATNVLNEGKNPEPNGDGHGGDIVNNGGDGDNGNGSYEPGTDHGTGDGNGNWDPNGTGGGGGGTTGDGTGSTSTGGIGTIGGINSGGGVLKVPYNSKGCGFRNFQGVGFRITGNDDHEAQFGEFPWMVAILAKDPKGDVYVCGGSLIHEKVVLTAAHCLKGRSPFDLTIRAGEWDTQTSNEPLPYQNRRVALAVQHPNYYAGALHNDFALLILEQPVELAGNVDTVCLPMPDDNFDNTRCTTTGWGKDVFGDRGRYQSILKSVDLPTVPAPKCQNSLRHTRLSQYFNLHESFMCAGGEEGVDACTGDGGSPLVCPMYNDPTRFVQAGIVAWGIGCGQKDVPGVYANVAKARPWIDEQLRNYNIDVSTLPLDSIRIKPSASAGGSPMGSGNPFLDN